MPWPNSSLDVFADQSFFLEHGDRAYWYQAQMCPCGTDPNAVSDMSQANNSCQVCGGLGVFYPNAPTVIRGTVSNAVEDRTILNTGFQLNASDLIWSSSPWSQGPLSPFDGLILISPQSAWPFDGQTVVRGSGNTDVLFYTPAGIDAVYTVDSSTGAYTAYTGATVSGKSIDWSTAPTAPPTGTQYSVRARVQYEWYVYTPPMVRYENTQSLGQKVVLRKRHIVYNSTLPILQPA